MKSICTLAILLFLTCNIQAQKKKTLFKIDGTRFYTDEFLFYYKKHNAGLQRGDFDTYLKRYADFKIKLTEAKKLHLDTLTSFQTEMQGYKSQVQERFLFKNTVVTEVAKILYKRKKQEVHLQHLFLKLNYQENDTNALYAKADSIYKLLETGADFSDLARKYSDEKATAVNGGDVPWFSLQRLPFDFVSHIETIKNGKYGPPVRSPKGYHFFKVVGRRPYSGKVKIAHILRYFPEDVSKRKSALDSVRAIVERARKGENFTSLVGEFSDDESTQETGGELPWFEAGQMLQEIDSTAFSLSLSNPISTAVQSRFGWHIIKLLDKRKLESWEEQKEELKHLVSSSRNLTDGKAYLLRLQRAEHEYKKKGELNILQSWFDECTENKKWNTDNIPQASSILFEIGSLSFTFSDFVQYLATNTQIKSKRHIGRLKVTYEEFVNVEMEKYIDRQLIANNQEFQLLWNEYHDGVLVFDVLRKQVWKPMESDTLGLRSFYEQNEHNYVSEPSVLATVLKAPPAGVKYAKEIMAISPTCSYISLQDSMRNKGFEIDSLQTRSFTGSHNAYMASVLNAYENGDKNKMEYDAGNELLYFIYEYKPATAQKLNIVRGRVMADYQGELENKWLKSLRNKHKVKWNKKSIRLMKKEVSD